MKVFLSSTAQDLEAYRRVADDTILRLAKESVAMERFGPLPNAPVEECEQLARDSDVVVCIVAHRYGYVPEKGGYSITRREVEAAHKAGKDVLVWIVDDNHPWTEKKEQDLLADPSVVADPAKIADIVEGIAGLLDFKSWLRTTFTPETFTTPDDLGRKLAVALANYVKGRSAPPVPQNKISISRLPTTSSELFGRETELHLLDTAWANPTTNIVSFVAWGGAGKTALVNHWLKRRMARDNYRGADRVYSWSFFSQGTSERAASADLFINQALRWFGDADPTAGTPWDKGERLAGYIRQSCTLLILDGLEPLQHPLGFQEGRLKDPAVQALLIELAAHQPGLCVISTRQRVGDLVEFEHSTVIQHNLEHLSPQAGAQILQSFNVKGDAEELEQAAIELGGHAFSLTLLGSYLDEVLDGDIRRRKEINDLFSDTRYGDAAKKMIAAYEKWLGEGIDLAILRLLGLFDRPADLASIEALLKPPAISGLTEPLRNLKGSDWNRAVSKLRRIKLLAGTVPNELGTLDAHPLVREYFKQYLKVNRANAWSDANNRLYEHFTRTAKEYPDTIEEMSLLYAAVMHGCAANKHREVLRDVYLRRMQRGGEHYNWHTLGAYSASLVVMFGFFERPWDRPITSLPNPWQSLVLNDTGFCLRTLGRLREAIQPTSHALDLLVAEEDWTNGSKCASNLLELHTAIGDLVHAFEVAQRGVELADHSNDVFVRGALRAALADLLHRLGRIDEAAAAYSEVQDITKGSHPDPLFVSWWGFLYREFLLTQGEVSQMRERAEEALKHSLRDNWPVMIGLDNVSLGRAWLLENGETKSDISKAAQFINTGMDLLRQAGRLDRLPYGLLARAMLHRYNSDFEGAQRDLSEIHRIATLSGMNLHLADYHLESARLRLSQNSKLKARKHLATAKEMINSMGYHRRDKEVAELEAQLA